MSTLVKAAGLLLFLALAARCAEQAPRLRWYETKHRERVFTMVEIAVPTIPGFKCDVWCYEDKLGRGQGHAQSDGSLVLEHSRPGQDGPIDVTTTFVPRPGEVDFVVNVRAKSRRDVLSQGSVNACWQMRNSPGFRHEGSDFVNTFVNHCFVYTVRGFTVLRDTTRFPDTRRPSNDRRNTPPWVQVYLPIWRRHGGQPRAFWGNSTDRPVHSIIGQVSRDGKHLIALAWPTCSSLCQGWHDCLHIQPVLRDGYDEKTGQIVYRGRFYFMDNDPQALLERYKGDLAVGDRALNIAACDTVQRGLLVSCDALPGHKVELHVPGSAVSTAHAPAAWRREWWATWIRTGRAGPCRFAAWVRAYEHHVNVYLTVHNETNEPADAPGSALIRFGGWRSDRSGQVTSGDGQRVAAFTWEGREPEAVQRDLLVCDAGLGRLAPGETKTIRGRLYLAPASGSGLAKRMRTDQAEWARAAPFRLAIPAK